MNNNKENGNRKNKKEPTQRKNGYKIMLTKHKTRPDRYYFKNIKNKGGRNE